MSSSIPISPFAQPSAPPPPVIVLLDATELYFEPVVSLLAFEDLQPDISLDASPGLPIIPSVRISLDTLPDPMITPSTRYHPYGGRRAGHAPPSPRFPSHSATTTRDVTPQLVPRGNSPVPAGRAFTSPLSSPTPSPRLSPPPSDRHVSFAPVSTKIKIQRPKGAGRKNLQSQVKWEEAFLTNVKVHFSSSYLKSIGAHTPPRNSLEVL